MIGIKTYSRTLQNSSELRSNHFSKNNIPQKINNNLKKNNIIISISISVFILIIITLILLFLFKSWVKKPPNDEQKTHNINFEEYMNELQFKTKVNDIKRLSIIKTFYDNMQINGINSQISLISKRDYDIFIISEKECIEENKKYCNKIYTASIAMVSQCLSLENEECEPQKLVDLSNNNKTNLLNLNETIINDLKDIPIALCLFNLSDTNIITSISCPETLPQNIKEELLSDLYYFRPFAKKFSDKKDQMNITIENKNKNIGRKVTGLCDIKNRIISFCDVDMIISKDSEGNLLSLNETSINKINTDKLNILNKKILTQLIDKTSKINSLNPDKYKSILNDLFDKLKPYMKYEEIFSLDQIINNSSNKINIKEAVNNIKRDNNNKIKRYLTNEGDYYLIKNQSLFYKEILGIKIDLNLKYDSGINVESMKTFSYLKFDDIENELDNNIQFTNLNRAIKKLLSLSKTGNYLAYQLYEKLKNNLDKLTQEITINISNLNSLIIYKDLTEIFDSTLSINSLKILPTNIVEQSNNFVNKLNINLNEIEKSGIDNYINILNNEINYYFTNSLVYLNNTFNNLNKLGNLLNSQKSKFAEIPNIYSNNTPTSYVNTIQEVKNLHLNYGKVEYDIINNEIESTLTEFESNYYSSIIKQINFVNNLNTNVQNKSFIIDKANNEDYEQFIYNLNNSNNITNNIFNIIKDKIKNIINSKINEYKILDSDKDKYNIITNKSNEIAYKLDNDEIVDKIYDKIMIIFKDNIRDIIKYMNTIKEEKFALVEDSLKEGLFTSSQKRKIKNNITNCAVNIINTIKRENEDYIESIISSIDEFIDENFENLTSIIFDLNILLSESSIKELSISYEVAFNNSINKIKNDILYNKKLIEDYYNEYNDVLEDKISLLEELRDYSIKRINKKISKGYLSKYNIYKNNILNIKQYLNNQLTNDLLDEYKKIITKTKEALQLIKNNKISELYPSISKFSFNDKHINNIEDINNIISKYFSLDIFNNNYLLKLTNFKNEQNEELENITNIIENHHNKLSKLEKSEVESDDDNNDICLILTYEMNMFGETLEFDFEDNCVKMKSCFDNYQKLVDISIYFGKIIPKFLDKFEYILHLVKQKVISYNSIINMVKDSLQYKKQELINKNKANDYLTPIKNQINVILSEKYGEKILNSSYNYYKNNIKIKITNILNEINSKFNDSFYLLEQEIKNNVSKFKYSFEGFSNICQILKDLIVKDIIFEYSDSIINLQRNEFNYTVSFYYNYLLQIVNSTYLYIINNIPTNELNINTIIDLRKREIKEEFNKIIQNIMHSKNNVFNINNQLNILKIEESNFFGLNSTINDIISNISIDLNNRIESINIIDNNKVKDQFSIASNLYLENSENGKNNKEFYKEIYDTVFIELNKEKFKQLLLDNWIFDQDYIINKLNISLFNSNKEILNEFLIKKRNYTSILEKEINIYFTKENILDKINNLYNNEIQNFNTTQLEEIQNNVNETIRRINEHLYNESRRLKENLVSLTNNFAIINSTINSYKEGIYEEIKTLLYNIIDKFKENLNNKVYKEYIEIGLNNYITESKKYTKDLKQYNLLNSTFNLGEIIDNIIEDLVNEYKELVKRHIEYKYQMKLKEIYDMEALKTFIYNEIDNEYNSNLFSVLKEKAIIYPGEIGYSEYDLDDIIKKDIESTIKNNINNIKNIFLSIKGDNYEVNLSNSKNDINNDNWEILEFSKINIKIIEIKEYFEKFINYEKNYEKNYIDESIKNIIKENFNNSLNNILLSFGNDFFERELKYNQFFRISGLYDNLKYSIIQTMSYYLNINTDIINTLPKDLKTKIINMNNIELLIEENNNYLINSIIIKIKDFINDSKDYLVSRYLEYMGSEAIISMRFNEEIVTIINYNLEASKKDIEIDFTNLINTYLNEIFIYPYNNTLNEKRDKLIKIINEFRDKFISEKGDLFTLESDNILEEINSQINNTIDSINEYKSHLNLIKVPDELVLYLNNYSINNIKPIYDEFKNKINISDNQIIFDFEENTNNYQKAFNSDIFVTNVNNTIINLKNNYIDKLNNYINNYCKDYSQNFSNEYYKFFDKYGRRLEEDDNKIDDKPIDETLGKLLNSSENSKIYVETLKELNDLQKNITNNINNLNIAFKESHSIIQDSNYEDEVKNNFYNILPYLKEISLDYYKKVNESYYTIKQYLNESLLNINNEIEKCINITYETLINEYQKFSKEEESINVTYSKTEERLNPIYYNYNAGELKYHITAKITNFLSYAEFKYGVEFENNDYRYPKIVASIINKSKPNNINIDIYCYFGNCGKQGKILDINLNEVNYKMNLYFDTKTDSININTITNFQKYEYTLELYTLQDNDELECFTVAYINFCINPLKFNNKITKSIDKFSIDKKELNEIDIIKIK